MSDALGEKSSQAIEPTLSGNSSEVRALWRLSLILREIAESLASDAEKGTPPRQAPAGDGLTNGEELSPVSSTKKPMPRLGDARGKAQGRMRRYSRVSF